MKNFIDIIPVPCNFLQDSLPILQTSVSQKHNFFAKGHEDAMPDCIILPTAAAASSNH